MIKHNFNNLLKVIIVFYWTIIGALFIYQHNIQADIMEEFKQSNIKRNEMYDKESKALDELRLLIKSRIYERLAKHE